MDSNIPPEEWVDPAAPITLTFDRLPTEEEGQLAVLLDKTDLSALFQQTGDSEISYLADGPPLPSGSQELIIYVVRSPTEWEELTRVPINVLTPSGFEVADTSPQLEIALKTQLDSNTKGDVPPLERDTYEDFELQLGLETLHKRGTFELRSNASASGFSNRQDTLRYSELQEDSPKLDLNDYLIEAESPTTLVSLGHFGYGNNPLLISNVNNRGTRARYRLNERLDLASALCTVPALSVTTISLV